MSESLFDQNTNAGWFFYRGSYGEQLKIKSEDFSKESSKMTGIRLNSIPAESFVTKHQFDLSACYPGLLVGSGYQHETGVEGEFKIGFFFDYSTGLPQIPGSSVKGMLRSFFPGREKDEPDKPQLKQPKYAYIMEKLRQITQGKPLPVTPSLNDIERLEKEIFEGLDYSKGGDSLLSIYRRDRFFDAVLSPDNVAHGKFLGSDYITPHKDPLDNPLPLMFLKVLPSTLFRFRFELTDSHAIAGVDKSIKLKLFKSIILDAGIGAKTNVGYGQFEEVTRVNKPVVRVAPPPPQVEEKPILPQHQPSKSSVPDNKLPFELTSHWKPGIYPLEVKSVTGDYFEVEFKPKGQRHSASLYKNKYRIGRLEFTDFAEKLSPGQQVILRINSPYSITGSLNFTILLEP